MSQDPFLNQGEAEVLKALQVKAPAGLTSSELLLECPSVITPEAMSWNLNAMVKSGSIVRNVDDGKNIYYLPETSKTDRTKRKNPQPEAPILPAWEPGAHHIEHIEHERDMVGNGLPPTRPSRLPKAEPFPRTAPVRFALTSDRTLLIFGLPDGDIELDQQATKALDEFMGAVFLADEGEELIK